MCPNDLSITRGWVWLGWTFILIYFLWVDGGNSDPTVGMPSFPPWGGVGGTGAGQDGSGVSGGRRARFLLWVRVRLASTARRGLAVPKKPGWVYAVWPSDGSCACQDCIGGRSMPTYIWEGTLTWFHSHLTNTAPKAINSLVQVTKARAPR